MTVESIECFKTEEIRSIRLETGLTQILFTKYRGVSDKTVVAWEAGRNYLERAACRLLSMIRNNQTVPQKSGIALHWQHSEINLIKSIAKFDMHPKSV